MGHLGNLTTAAAEAMTLAATRVSLVLRVGGDRRAGDALHGHRRQARVIVYTRPGCPYSMRLRTKLRLARIGFQSVDIWADDTARALVRRVNGGDETVPTVQIGEVFLTNPGLREVRAALG